MVPQAFFTTDLFDLNPNYFSAKDAILWADLAVIRIFRLFREILGPDDPDLLDHRKKYKILFNENLVDKFLLPQNEMLKNWREIEILKKFRSDEYIFWGNYFKKWEISDYWLRDEGTLPYAEYVTKIRKDGSNVIDKKIMKVPTIDAISKNILKEIDQLYPDLELIEYVKNHIKLLWISLERLSTAARISTEQKLKKIYIRSLNKISDDIKNIEPIYVVPQLFNIKKTCDHLVKYFFNHKLKEGGWKHDHDTHGKANPLNTGEVVCPLFKTLPQKELYKLDKTKDFLLEACSEKGYWQTTRLPPHEESPFANAFATNFLIKSCGLDEPIISKAFNRVRNYINNYDNFGEVHYFASYCQSIRTVANGVKYGRKSLKLNNELANHKNSILKAIERYWKNEDANRQKYKESFFATSMGLLAISFIDDALNEFDGNLRYHLADKVLSHPERPFPNKVTWYHPQRDKEFTHWILPWSISALSKQPFVDNLVLLNLTRNLLKHYNPLGGVSYSREGRFYVWAAGHMLYALQNTLDFFSLKSTYRNYYKDGKFCFDVN